MQKDNEFPRELPSQFPSAKAFADYISSKFGRSVIIALNKQNGRDRLQSLASRMEFFTHYHDGSDYCMSHYERVMDGLGRFIRSERATPYASQALYTMNTRQLCELVYELAHTCVSLEKHCRILNKRYTPAA